MDKIKSKNEQMAKTLRKLRLKAGYTQQNIADALNINRSTYTYYETGKTTPDLHTLSMLAKMYGVSAVVFLEDEMSLEDVGKKRPKKRVYDNPDMIGELSSKEKSLIALIRTSNKYNIDNIIADLKKK